MKKESSKNVSENVISEGVGGGKNKKDTLYKNEVYKNFVEYYALPDPDKCAFLEIAFDTKLKKYVEEPTMKLFAKKFGVHTNTLTGWKKREDFLSAVDRRRKEWGMDRTSNVLSALYRRCIQYGMSYDVETYLAYFEGWDKKKAIEAPTTKFGMDDIRAIIAPLPKDKQEKFYAIITQIITEAESARGDSEVQGDQLDESGSNKG